MTERLMSDERHAQLMKAAEETIGLMNLPGVDPNAALAKVAVDNAMNDHEIDLVANAVNNSKQLAHLQDSKPEDREKSFPLIDSEKVKSTNKLQPATNADQYTGGRYGTQETPSESAERAIELGRDAIDVKEEVEKTAAASRRCDRSYWPSTEPDYEAVLRSGWGLSAEKVASAQLAPYVDAHLPFRKLSAIDVGIEEARTREELAKKASIDLLRSLDVMMRRTAAPEWAPIAKAAMVNGCDPDFLQLVGTVVGQPVSLEKTAGRMYITPQQQTAVDIILAADQKLKLAAAYRTGAQELERRRDELTAKLLPKAGMVNPQIDIDPGQIAGHLGTIPSDYFIEPERMRMALHGSPAGSKEELTTRSAIPLRTRQEIRNADTRDVIEQLMSDSYIGSHSLPDVIDAYNQAMSINPSLGVAELTSYMRQHLATQGAVPLDLQVRARERAARRAENEEGEY